VLALIAIASRVRFPTTQKYFALWIIAGLMTPLLGVMRARAILNPDRTKNGHMNRTIAALTTALRFTISGTVRNRERTGVPMRASRVGWWMRAE